jgi:cyclic pyranopterin monophosphate synthase
MRVRLGIKPALCSRISLSYNNTVAFKNTTMTENISPPPLTHLDATGEAQMVDVAEKSTTVRVAVAQGYVRMKPETMAAIASGNAPKGDVIGTARLAGIMAAKQTANLIPLCHPLPIQKVAVTIEPDETTSGYRIEAMVKIEGKTGVEMEALTAVSIAALTLYDMAKALEKEMTIEGIQLLSKSGGKSGDYQAPG